MALLRRRHGRRDSFGGPPIESLEVGDLVLARTDSESDDSVAPRRILRTFVRDAPSLIDVRTISVDGERESVRSTPEHLYYTLNRGWVTAGDLIANETLVDRSGSEVRVTKVLPIAQEAAVYNIEVDVDHTYFVGHSAVWVHNQCPRDVDSSPLERQPMAPGNPEIRAPGNPEIRAPETWKYGLWQRLWDVRTNGLRLVRLRNESTAGNVRSRGPIRIGHGV